MLLIFRSLKTTTINLGDVTPHTHTHLLDSCLRVLGSIVAGATIRNGPVIGPIVWRIEQTEQTLLIRAPLKLDEFRCHTYDKQSQCAPRYRQVAEEPQHIEAEEYQANRTTE